MTPPMKSFWELEITTPEQADSIVENLNELERKRLLDALNKKIWDKEEKKESKETVTKSLEFEENTFKIDSTWWEETTIDTYNGKPIKVKENTTWDVVEYLEWPAKWEQIFITYDAFIREVMKAKNCSKEEVEKKYLMTVDELHEKMKDKTSSSDEYKIFFNKKFNVHLAGYWNPDYEIFYDVWERSNVWLVGGANVNFNRYGWNRNDDYRDYGFSGRLLKN